MAKSWRGLFFAGALLLAIAPPCLAADMEDVRRALAEQRYFDAFADLQDLATGGNSEAQFELAGFHHYGRIGSANFQKALNWYTRAANQGNADAMIGLAVLYGHGQGVTRDTAIAYRWLAIANLQQLGPETQQRVAMALNDLRVDLSQQQVSAAEKAAREFNPKPE